MNKIIILALTLGLVACGGGGGGAGIPSNYIELTYSCVEFPGPVWARVNSTQAAVDYYLGYGGSPATKADCDSDNVAAADYTAHDGEAGTYWIDFPAPMLQEIEITVDAAAYGRSQPSNMWIHYRYINH